MSTEPQPTFAKTGVARPKFTKVDLCETHSWLDVAKTRASFPGLQLPSHSIKPTFEEKGTRPEAMSTFRQRERNTETERTKTKTKRKNARQRQ